MNLSRISTRVILFDASFSAGFLHRANAHSCHWRARATQRDSRGNSCAANYCIREVLPAYTVSFIDDTQPCLRLCALPSVAPPAPHLPSSSVVSRTTPSVLVLIIIHHATTSNGCATSFIRRLLAGAIAKSLRSFA